MILLSRGDFMSNTDVLRMILLIGENDISAFNKNLLKYIEAVMFESKQIYYSAEQISSLIKDHFYMEFTEKEVVAAINSKRGNKATILYNPQNKRYFLQPKKVETLNQNNNVDKFNKLIELFLKSDLKYLYSLEEAKKLLYDFFLYTINENITLLMELCNQKFKYNFIDKSGRFKDSEKTFINDFLSWDNSEKNKYIYYIISFCWDYCKLTLKSGNKSFRYLFNNKVFFLDSNVIFRLYGINNQERKSVIEAFINKCEKAGITLFYTNFTYNELMESIHRNINAVATITQNRKPLDIKYYQNFINGNTEFLESYCKWSKENNSTNIKNFENSVKTDILSILRRFKRRDFIDYSKLNIKSDYAAYHKSLLEFKLQNFANNTHKNSITIDINNWLNIHEIRNQENGTDMRSIHTFIISTDRHFCNWSRTILPGAIPLVVRPSIWHSILLKFSSRSEEDFKAFLSFLKLRLSENTCQLDSRRPKIFVKVLERNYDNELSEIVLNFIDNNLITEYKNTQDLDYIINDADEKVISTIRTQAIDKAKDKILDEGIEQGVKKGEIGAYEKIACKKAKFRMKIFSRFKLVHLILSSMFFLIGVITLIYIIRSKQLSGFLFWANNNPYQWNVSHWISLINLLIWILITVPNKIFKSYIDVFFENGDFDKLKDKFLRQLKEKY